MEWGSWGQAICIHILGDLLMFTTQILRPAVHDFSMVSRMLLAAHSPAMENASRSCAHMYM